MKYKQLIFFLFLFLVISCTQNDSNNLINAKQKFIKASDFLELVDSTQLETNNNCILTTMTPNFVVLNNGNFIIIDNFRGKKVYQFNQKGKYIQTIGREGQGPGEYSWPKFGYQTKSGNINIYDGNSSQTHVYKNNGKYLETINYSKFFDIIRINTVNEKIFFRFYAIDDSMTTMIKYSENNKIIKRFGKHAIDIENVPPTYGGGIALDKNDNIYNMVPYEYKINKYNSNGELLNSYDVKLKNSPYYIPFKEKELSKLTTSEKHKWLNSFTIIGHIEIIKDYLLVLYLSKDREMIYDIFSIKNGHVRYLNSFLMQNISNMQVKDDYLYMIKESSNKDSNPCICKYAIK